jgi:hypothetical protein
VRIKPVSASASGFIPPWRPLVAWVGIGIGVLLRIYVCALSSWTNRGGWSEIPTVLVLVGFAILAAVFILLIVLPTVLELLLVRQGRGWIGGLVNLATFAGGVLFGIFYWWKESNHISMITGNPYARDADTEVSYYDDAIGQALTVYVCVTPAALALVTASVWVRLRSRTAN